MPQPGLARTIWFIVFPGFELLDLGGPLCAFNLAIDYHHAAYEVRVVSAAGGLVRGSSGVAIDTIAPPSPGHLDTLVVVGAPSAEVLDRQSETVDLVRALAPRARRKASVCTGAFLLAAAGLLDGHRATTHWRYAPELQRRHPLLRVDADRIFVREDDIWTSAGITAGIDLALAMIEEDCGIATSKAIARDLVVYHRRSGGQSQFSTMLELEPRPGRIRDALAYARSHLRERLSVEQLADVAMISPRQFARQFTAETGETPARAVERLRCEAALPQIEASTEPLDQIAIQVGFGDMERMRRVCLRIYGQTPQALRRRGRALEAAD
ncbi:GlxA family transcriptional regulator [Novosphingobium sp. FSW06-99]|uniref:GlxA family transcriptional regulator n=1 Tax=Novosphingobium sp. FSW06-99 TaxID=1739113 RepID=UPI00076CABF8|nr:DJ-1/PfpI family protein [Novosphingobium sp. FSW06-99]KUR74991.1 AraC family transcriptional regulator [Novosphingobium sp. FSW06-99]